MNMFYTIGACMLALGALCIQMSNGATTSVPSVTTGIQTEATTNDVTTGTTPPGVTDVVTDALNNATVCPRFTTRLENETLYISYIEGSCDLVVTVERISLPPLRTLQRLNRRRPRVIRRPVVSFRPVGSELASCESLPNRSLGPFVFVDTVIDECQMLIKVQKLKNEAFIPGQKRPGKGAGKRPRIPRRFFVPALDYLDEMVY
ncbi:uncharacterized protein LOC117341042 [Pecten maximus]|uniref:uncharacterized protein LOC117341042 n=1 Tax=Pecten maximus TaxID=6579 RepID=UPI001458C76F|nr:uncharacterized protein LOC117341042 [Pecten maximus]